MSNPQFLQAAHLFFAVFLVAAMFADTFFVRTQSLALAQPQELSARWRTRLALLEMFLLMVVLMMGILRWMPLMSVYSAQIFHAKIGLSIMFLLLGKARMMKERRSGTPQIVLTRLMFFVLLCILCLGIYAGAGGAIS